MLNQLTVSARIKIERFTDKIYEMMQQAKETDSATLTRDLVDNIQYRDWLLESCKNLKTARKRIENVDELLDWVTRQTSEQEECISLEQLMAQLSLMNIIERNNDEQFKDAVQLMTLHAAKGLEFSHVWIAGMEEDMLPHHSHADTGLLEEERRLAYVGITRAQQHLSLSYATQRSRYGEPLDCEPSRFLQELPKEHVCWETGELNPRDPKAREAGKAHLSNLRAMLID
jgi:ATP-dependent DNA helicase Rep